MELMLKNEKIRELNIGELSLVGGGISLGTGTGGIFGAAGVGAALRLAGGLGLLYQSGKFGWDLGSWGYNTYTNYRYHRR
ncbi:MAG: hypothetical protein ACI909_002547 [Planctomycetota bacterium]|jgi:hypothetical protein